MPPADGPAAIQEPHHSKRFLTVMTPQKEKEPSERGIPAERSFLMGEIILSIAIGGCLVVAGIIMNVYLRYEEKHLNDPE